MKESINQSLQSMRKILFRNRGRNREKGQIRGAPKGFEKFGPTRPTRGAMPPLDLDGGTANQQQPRRQDDPQFKSLHAIASISSTTFVPFPLFLSI